MNALHTLYRHVCGGEARDYCLERAAAESWLGLNPGHLVTTGFQGKVLDKVLSTDAGKVEALVYSTTDANPDALVTLTSSRP